MNENKRVEISKSCCFCLALAVQRITDSQLPRGAILTDLNDEIEENIDDQQIQNDFYQNKKSNETRSM